MTLSRTLPLYALMAASLVLTGCGAGERLSNLNPFQGEETDDPNAPPETERRSVLELGDTLRVDEAGVVSLPRAYVNTAWPQADGYPTHAMQHTQASGDLNIVWRSRIGAGSSRNARINARPVVSDGVTYVIDASGRISALNLSDGEEIWRTRLDDPSLHEAQGDGFLPFFRGGDQVLTFGGGLSFDSGRIYAHSGGGFFVALDAATGDEVWRAHSLTPFHSSPTVADGRVFVSTDDNELLALDASTGDVLWTHRSIAETARILTSPSPAVLGEVVIAPYSSGELVALRAQNGTVLWSDSLTRAGGLTPLSTINDIAASPVILGDAVYAMSHSGSMAAFDIRSGERIWEQPAGGLNAPTIAGDFLFLTTVNAELVAIERNTGAVRWLTQLQQFRNERKRKNRVSWAGPILAGGRLVVASSEGDLRFYDPATGEQTGDRDLGDSVYIAPVIADETVLVLTDEGRLIALR